MQQRFSEHFRITNQDKNIRNDALRRNTRRKPWKSQATKGIRWMPWRQESKKDAISCEKPWGAANRPRSTDVRMGQPSASHVALPERETNPVN